MSLFSSSVFHKLFIRGLQSQEPWQEEARQNLREAGLSPELPEGEEELLLFALALSGLEGNLDTTKSETTKLLESIQEPSTAKQDPYEAVLQTALYLGHEELLEELLQRYENSGHFPRLLFLPQLVEQVDKHRELLLPLRRIFEQRGFPSARVLKSRAFYLQQNPEEAFAALSEEEQEAKKYLQAYRLAAPQAAAAYFAQVLPQASSRLQDTLLSIWTEQAETSDLQYWVALLEASLPRPSLRRRLFEACCSFPKSAWAEALRQELLPFFPREAEQVLGLMDTPECKKIFVQRGALGSRQLGDTEVLRDIVLRGYALFEPSVWEKELGRPWLELIDSLSEERSADLLFLQLLLQSALLAGQDEPLLGLWQSYLYFWERNPFSPAVELLAVLEERLPDKLLAAEVGDFFTRSPRYALTHPLFKMLSARSFLWPQSLAEKLFPFLEEQLQLPQESSYKVYVQAVCMRAAYNLPASLCQNFSALPYWNEQLYHPWRKEIQQMLFLWYMRGQLL